MDNLLWVKSKKGHVKPERRKRKAMGEGRQELAEGAYFFYSISNEIATCPVG